MSDIIEENVLQGGSIRNEFSLQGKLHQDVKKLRGTIQNEFSLRGAVYQETGILRGTLYQDMATLRGTVQAPSGLDVDAYLGPYDIRPDTVEQILNTEEKFMKKNVTIEEIPYYETSNDKGGITVIIGGLYNA